MKIEEVLGFVPADKQDEAKAALAELSKGYVKLSSESDVEAVISNPLLKPALDRIMQKAVSTNEERWEKEKLPARIDEEIQKRAPKPKDPELAAALARVEKLEAENKTKAREAALAMQKAKAQEVLTSKGFPAKLADFYIGETDDETNAKLAAFFEVAEPFVKDQVTKAVTGVVGNQGIPPAGKPQKPEDLSAQYAEAIKDPKRVDEALMIREKIEAIARSQR